MGTQTQPDDFIEIISHAICRLLREHPAFACCAHGAEKDHALHRDKDDRATAASILVKNLGEAIGISAKSSCLEACHSKVEKERCSNPACSQDKQLMYYYSKRVTEALMATWGSDCTDSKTLLSRKVRLPKQKVERLVQRMPFTKKQLKECLLHRWYRTMLATSEDKAVDPLLKHVPERILSAIRNVLEQKDHIESKRVRVSAPVLIERHV